jgi:hypothetical protein
VGPFREGVKLPFSNFTQIICGPESPIPSDSNDMLTFEFGQRGQRPASAQHLYVCAAAGANLNANSNIGSVHGSLTVKPHQCRT